MKATPEVRGVEAREVREFMESRGFYTNKYFRDHNKQRFYKTTQLTGKTKDFFEFLKNVFYEKEGGREYFGAIFPNSENKTLKKKHLRLGNEGFLLKNILLFFSSIYFCILGGTVAGL